MSNLREIKGRLRGIRKTRQITRAMKMVATVKLRHAQTALANARPYMERMREITAQLLAGLESLPLDHPFLIRREIKKALLVVVATDRGLCGSLNTNLFRQALNFHPASPEVEFLLIGRKARDFFKTRRASGATYQVRDAMLCEGADIFSISQSLCEWYRFQAVDRVDLFYTAASSALRQKPEHLCLFPLDLGEMRKSGSAQKEYALFEPAAAEMLDDIICAYAENTLRRIFLEAAVAEHAARMFTMDLATKNADELISDMQLDMNKLRQLLITRELEDITTGVEAIG
jgi:F-type H+-transporting ATPase subunit gamma